MTAGQRLQHVDCWITGARCSAFCGNVGYEHPQIYWWWSYMFIRSVVKALGYYLINIT
jgi:hypothetical protein